MESNGGSHLAREGGREVEKEGATAPRDETGEVRGER